MIDFFLSSFSIAGILSRFGCCCHCFGCTKGWGYRWASLWFIRHCSSTRRPWIHLQIEKAQETLFGLDSWNHAPTPYILIHTQTHSQPPNPQQHLQSQNKSVLFQQKSKEKSREKMSYPKIIPGRNEFTLAKYWITILALLLLFSFVFFLLCLNCLFIHGMDKYCWAFLTHHTDYLSHDDCKRISHASYLSAQITHKHTHQHFLIFSLQYFV